MSHLRAGTCSEPGPYSSHCTEPPLHQYSCYDAGDDSSWNDRSPEGWQTETPHVCEDARCAQAARRVVVRRWASDALHYADDPVTFESEVFQRRCEAVRTPVVTLCAATLKGTVLVMEPEYRPRDDGQPHPRPVPVCRRCKAFAARLPEREVSWPRYAGPVE